MSDNRPDPFMQKPERYGDISTEELEDLIGDMLLDNNADLKLVDELLEAYGEREGVPDIDVGAAWARFQRDYSGQGEIYLTDDADNPTQTANRGNTHGRAHKRRRLLRAVAVAAALIVSIMLFLTSTAAGGSLWRTFVKWGSESFSFIFEAGPKKPNEQLAGLYDAMGEHGIPYLLAPTWIPEGFVLVYSEFYELPLNLFFVAYFEGKNGTLIFHVTSHNDYPEVKYEYTHENGLPYLRSEIEHYIILNGENNSITWMYERYECLVIGDFAVDDAIRIIDSIYER